MTKLLRGCYFRMLAALAAMLLAALAAMLLAAPQATQPAAALDAAPATGTIVAVHPATATLAAGETLLVEVWVENVVDLYGADVQLQFDPTALRVLDANPNLPGVQISLRTDLLLPGFTIHREANNQAGTIWYANSQVYPAAPASGSGALMEFVLLALKNGDYPLAITSQQLSDQNGNSIAASSQGATITIQGYKMFQPLVMR